MTKNYPYEYGSGQQQSSGYGSPSNRYQEPGQYPPVPSYDGAPSYDNGSYGCAPQPSYEGVPAHGYNSNCYNQQQQPPEYQSQPYERSSYNTTHQESNQSSQYDAYPSPAPTAGSPQPMPGNTNEADRGVMGALAGGAAGAYAGHKVHHGFIGALGGAFAGHKLEDAIKDKHKEDKKKKKEHEQQQFMPPAGPPPAYSQYHQGHPQQQHLGGNFSGSATDVALDRDFDLIARCRAVDGSQRMSALPLNKVLGNSNGSFCWVENGGNFAASARNVRLVNGGKVLEAELKDVDGHWRGASIWLDERIGNADGELVFV